MLLDSSEQHTPGQHSSYLSAQRSTFHPPRSPVLTSPPGLGPPVLSTNHSSTHTSAASGVRQDGRVFRDHSALAQLCGFGPPKNSKFCTQCVSESAHDSELLFNVIAHLGNPGAREIVQLLVVTSVSAGNPCAMEPTLSSSLLFNMIVHLGNPGAREIVKLLVLNSVSSGNPDAMEPSLSSSLAVQTPSHPPHLSPPKSNTGSSHPLAILHPRSNTWSSHLQAIFQTTNTTTTTSSTLGHTPGHHNFRRSSTKLQSPGRHVFRRPHTIGKK